jgi:hypothetical protein
VCQEALEPQDLLVQQDPKVPKEFVERLNVQNLRQMVVQVVMVVDHCYNI